MGIVRPCRSNECGCLTSPSRSRDSDRSGLSRSTDMMLICSIMQFEECEMRNVQTEEARAWVRRIICSKVVSIDSVVQLKRERVFWDSMARECTSDWGVVFCIIRFDKKTGRRFCCFDVNMVRAQPPLPIQSGNQKWSPSAGYHSSATSPITPLVHRVFSCGLLCTVAKSAWE
jgi:hypothetical protein